jgi:hypothetical protein
MYHEIMRKITIPAHVDTVQIITWLHDHVGPCKVKWSDRYVGEHWCWDRITEFLDEYASLEFKHVVTFDDQVDLDLICEFQLTFV